MRTPVQLLTYLTLSLLSLGVLGTPEEAKEHSVQLYQWPISAASPAPLYKISYRSTHTEGKIIENSPQNSCALAGTCADDDEIVRVGIVDEARRFRGCITNGKSLKSPEKASITLRLDSNTGAGKIWRVEFQSIQTLQRTQILIANSTPGPEPFLNKPVILNAEGKIPEAAVEKTFLQKYWWVLLAGALLMLSGGGGAE